MDEERLEKRKIKVNKSGDEGEDVIEVREVAKKAKTKSSKKMVILIFVIVLGFSLFFKLWPVLLDFEFGGVEKVKSDSSWESL